MTTGVNPDNQRASLQNAIAGGQQRRGQAIVAERERQISKGYTVEHDREHGVRHLLNWSLEYSLRNEPVKAAALVLAALDILEVPVVSPESEGKK